MQLISKTATTPKWSRAAWAAARSASAATCSGAPASRRLSSSQATSYELSRAACRLGHGQ